MGGNSNWEPTLSLTEREEGLTAQDLTIKTWLYQAVGAAGLAWSEIPSGIFDSDRACAIAEALLKHINRISPTDKAAGAGPEDEMAYTYGEQRMSTLDVLAAFDPTAPWAQNQLSVAVTNLKADNLQITAQRDAAFGFITGFLQAASAALPEDEVAMTSFGGTISQVQQP